MLNGLFLKGCSMKFVLVFIFSLALFSCQMKQDSENRASGAVPGIPVAAEEENPPHVPEVVEEDPNQDSDPEEEGGISACVLSENQATEKAMRSFPNFNERICYAVRIPGGGPFEGFDNPAEVDLQMVANCPGGYLACMVFLQPDVGGDGGSTHTHYLYSAEDVETARAACEATPACTFYEEEQVGG